MMKIIKFLNVLAAVILSYFLLSLKLFSPTSASPFKLLYGCALCRLVCVLSTCINEIKGGHKVALDTVFT